MCLRWFHVIQYHQVSKNCVSKYLWVLAKSKITNLVSTDGVNMLLNATNYMDADVISCRNTCVSKPMSVHTDARVSSECLSISFFDVGLVDMFYIVFNWNHKPVVIISYVDNYILLLLYVVGLCVLWSYLPCSEHIVTLILSHFFICMENEIALK